MVGSMTLLGGAAFLLVFAGVLALGYWILFLRSGLSKQARARLRELSESPAPRVYPGRTARGLVTALLGSVAHARLVRTRLANRLRTQCLQAGLFDPAAPGLFLVARLALSLLLAAAGVAVCALDLTRGAPVWPLHGAGDQPFISVSVLLGAVAGLGVGFLGPSFWLAHRVRSRQRHLRHALPDALDIMILCCEGGLSVQAALQRVTDELQLVHPTLALEMNIVQRETELGLSPGEAFRKFADRCGLADVRDLAVILLQSERYGARVTQSLRNYAEAARVQRQQQAEEAAQKAAVKILFPTMLCIFPAILIVVLAPAAFQMTRLFSR